MTLGSNVIRQEGGVEFVTRDASIQPDRYTFANLDELTAYLGQVLGGQPEGGGIRGSMSRKGTYSRRAADGTQAVTFGDPVLDAISSADGALVIGGLRIDLREGHGSPEAPTGAGGGVVAFDAPYLKFTGIVNDAERWASDDGAMVQYRVGNGRLNFHAWKKHTFFQYWSMGGEISLSGAHTNFEAADIVSYYYMSVDSPCQVVETGQDSDRDDSYVDQYEWGINAQQPERVAVLCRAQWNNARFADIVTAGEGCLNYLNEAWPAGFPPDWPTDMGVNVRPDHLSMHVSGIGVGGSTATATVVNHDPDPRPLHIDAGTGVASGFFSYPTGDFTLQGNGGFAIPVMFLGGDAVGVYRTSLRIVVSGQVFIVPVSATVTQTGPIP